MISSGHKNFSRSAGAGPRRLPSQFDIVRGTLEVAGCDINTSMKRTPAILAFAVSLSLSALAQGNRLWVLHASGEMVEYDPVTFIVKQTVKVPAEALQAPTSVQINRIGQILFAPSPSLPLLDADLSSPHKLWLWDGHAPLSADLGISHQVGKTGSNQLITEAAPNVFLSADGTHLYWFANEEQRLQREDVDLSVTTKWRAWQTDLRGSQREEIASAKFPECSCPTGACEESCPIGTVWAPANGIAGFFLMTQFVAGKDQPAYKGSAMFRQQDGKWDAIPLAEPLRRVLDADSNGDTIVEAIPDTGCCGWVNQSDDQTVVLTNGKKLTVFDEFATYKNPDYDVSFYTSNARLSADQKSVAMTIVATAQVNQTIQLAQQGQANPEESRQIRKALAELPAVEVKSVEDTPRKLAFVPHATLVGWINEKELLIVEDHLLVVYNVATGAKRKSNIRAESTDSVFLR
jgi:hypothetical protein